MCFVSNRGAVDWKSMKQSIFATSSIDAEYIAAFDASKEAVWIYLEVSCDRLLLNILGGGSKLFAALSVARISLRLLDILESKPWFGP
ncbi:hypothetical protein Tco_0939453 [Tanacetum coccineum]|uniref:Uncharacterized protein n=1 Tax=Tanacetum coccineum TaxID=301880 RepID=A0ABQ5DLV0_9ASTR